MRKNRRAIHYSPVQPGMPDNALQRNDQQGANSSSYEPFEILLPGKEVARDGMCTVHSNINWMAGY
ncbi:hypothetical protein [Solemya velum gill symbiont]|uniref:hypothetical protein n=1 Tax=Solemya velum gill symbiont TaxID=2340 RepID=UPI001179B530|nr:hypothetical protein [Solemya velum gill symbiont]